MHKRISNKANVWSKFEGSYFMVYVKNKFISACLETKSNDKISIWESKTVLSKRYILQKIIIIV